MIDLVGKRYWYLAASLLIIIPGVIAILLGGLKPGIDFKGGTLWEVKPISAAADSTEKFRSVVAAAGYPDVLAKGGTIGVEPNITQTIIMNLPGQVTTEEKARLEGILANPQSPGGALVAGNFITETIALTNTNATATAAPAGATSATTPVGTTTTAATAATAGTTAAASAVTTGTVSATGTVTSTGATTAGTTATAGGAAASTVPTKQVSRWRIQPGSEINFYAVGPTVGQELIWRAFGAIALASLAILIYLSVVFRKVPNAFRYGVCAIIALLHDVLVVTGVFAILGFLFDVEIDALFITAMLTVIGFSVHDTIVVFDRVRENIVRRRFERFEDVVNYSVVQTLARSINTSITVLLTLFALYLFGGASIRTFVLALLIGILSGTYSSIFNASMLLVVWENREWSRSSRAQTPSGGARRATAR
jgi:preprotein translocase subunit SecF